MVTHLHFVRDQFRIIGDNPSLSLLLQVCGVWTRCPGVGGVMRAWRQIAPVLAGMEIQQRDIRRGGSSPRRDSASLPPSSLQAAVVRAAEPGTAGKLAAASLCFPAADRRTEPTRPPPAAPGKAVASRHRRNCTVQRPAATTAAVKIY